MKLFLGTKHWKNWWSNRKIDWKKDYTKTFNHPHRDMICALLTRFKWHSLYEVGCGGGANFVSILNRFKGVQLGGCDISADAIKTCQSYMQGAVLDVSPADEIMMSDDATDVVLSDMCLIYYKNPEKAIREMRRVTRRYLVLSELHTESWWRRMVLRHSSGYHAHNYKKLLEKHGFFNIELIKMTDAMWPGGNPQKEYGYFITAQKIKNFT